MAERDHIFLSYATEDAALADWLARKLAAAGYAVWYDRMKLLGGEPWPKDIDLAIKTRTFRMLALLSKASVQKDNPSRERTTAQAVGRDLKTPDFLITLNVDGLRPTEIPWTLSEINYIPFQSSWADGLAGVLKKLASVDAPRSLKGGSALAIETLHSTDFIRPQPERLQSNCFAVRQVPEVIHRFSATNAISDEDMLVVRREWPSRRVSPERFLAFDQPPPELAKKHGIKGAGAACWPSMPHVDHIPSRDLAVSLIHASIESHFAAKGLRFSKEQWAWYVPKGLCDGDWLRFTWPDGSAGRVGALGERSYRKEDIYRYYLSPSVSVLRGFGPPFVLVLRNRVYLTDGHDVHLEGRRVPSRRKHLCKNWWNEEWLARALGIMALLSTEEGVLSIGKTKESSIIIDANSMSYEVAVSIDETNAAPADADYLLADDEDEEEAEITPGAT